MKCFHEINGRRGYFLVVSLPYSEDGYDYQGGFESDFLTPENADSEADHINGGEQWSKAIFWQYCDEQPDFGAGHKAVRHLIGPVESDIPLLTKAEREGMKEELAELSNIPRKTKEQTARAREIVRAMRQPNAIGVWAACEAWLYAMAATPTSPTENQGQWGHSGKL